MGFFAFMVHCLTPGVSFAMAHLKGTGFFPDSVRIQYKGIFWVLARLVS